MNSKLHRRLKDMGCSVYLVGGAVRDELLDVAYHERDWVITGATPKMMQALGFTQVGQAFPVFIHPITGEEYALARTEKKIAPGYQGFSFNFDSTISLEQDLKRRDLTINAIAKDENGCLIDPYGGVCDLNRRILRHVSSAFHEDPLRVLRVARFYAKYYHLGFKISEQTQRAIYSIAKSGELSHLTPERVWHEWKKSFATAHPEQFIRALYQTGALKVIFPEINALFGVPNTYLISHTQDAGMQALHDLKSIHSAGMDDMACMAGFLKYLGKGMTPIDQWPWHFDLKKHSEIMIKALCARIKMPKKYQAFSIKFCNVYDDLCLGPKLKATQVLNVLEMGGAFKEGGLFDKLLATANICYQARGSFPLLFWQETAQLTKVIQAAFAIEKGYQGSQIKIMLNKKRLDVIKTLMEKYEA